ncbi:ExbD/TolR family protein [bacterium]
MEFEGRRKIDMRLDIAPLVDIVFLLLLFFLLTSQFIKQPGMKIDLPKAKAARVQDKQDIVVTITRDEKYFLNGRPVEKAGVESAVCEKLETSQRKIVIIKADRKTVLQPVVSVMDYAKRCRAEGVTITTKLKENAGAEAQEEEAGPEAGEE